MIAQRYIDVGSLITADATGGISMLSLIHSDVIRVRVYVPHDAAFGVKPGVEAIRVIGMPHLTFQGKVARLADALQPGTRTLLTEVDVPNPDGALQPGVYCTVELKIPRQSPALIVPASAMIFNQNGMQVASSKTAPRTCGKSRSRGRSQRRDQKRRPSGAATAREFGGR